LVPSFFAAIIDFNVFSSFAMSYWVILLVYGSSVVVLLQNLQLANGFVI